MNSFEQEISRKNTASIKWDEVKKIYEEEDILPFWIADMDFRVPEPVLEALEERVKHGIFGYTAQDDAYYEAIIGWMKKRHNWSIEKEWICHSPGIVPALSFFIQIYTQPGDKMIIQPPVYPPFRHVALENGRELVYNPLKLENGQYVMDFDDLRAKIDPDTKMLILCSPHNPVGRVWTEAELRKLGEICLEHNILVIADEIHFDLIFNNHKHIPFASLSEEFAQNSIICTAPSKTFNLAGLQTSNIIIPNPALREKFNHLLNIHYLGFPNIFGQLATASAYNHGEPWLEECLDMIQSNLSFLTNYIESHIPELKVIQPEGTYLVWIDCRELGMDYETLAKFMRHQAKIAINEGDQFGPGGEGFIRLNIACSQALLEQGLKRLGNAIAKL